MHRLYWTPKAYEDLAEIKRYIEQDDPEAAAEVVLGIIERAEQLKEFPESGPLMRDRRWQGDRMRVLATNRYLIFYRIDGGRVSVIRVLHETRDYTKILH